MSKPTITSVSMRHRSYKRGGRRSRNRRRNICMAPSLLAISGGGRAKTKDESRTMVEIWIAAGIVGAICGLVAVLLMEKKKKRRR